MNVIYIRYQAFSPRVSFFIENPIILYPFVVNVLSIRNKKLDKTYWNQRYLDFKTGWDIGCISFPLQTYFDQLSNKDLRILIAGCGNAYEAEYLHKNDFVNTYILDFSNTAINNFKKRVNTFPDENIFELNFFD